MNIKKFLVGSAAGILMFGAMITPAFADSVSVNFEPSTYTVGNINGQDGWAKTGSYDVAVVANTYGFATFGSQSLRMSDSITSGSFGDQTFAKPLVDAVGEADSTDSTFSRGTLQRHFETQFDLASTLATLQTGMHVSISPDRGDGSRMSYLRLEDRDDGIHIFFNDVQGTTNPANFVETDIATVSRSPHTIKLTMDLLDGPSNDVVKVYVDGALKITGTSWENYYRYDSEASAEQSPRIVKTVLFRESGDATTGNAGNGFLVDNLSMVSTILVAPSVPVITIPANGATVTTSAFAKVDWTDSTGGTPPVLYQYQAFSDAGYASSLYDSGMTLSASEIPTLGTTPGDYYLRVRAQGAVGPVSDWSNGASNAYKITVVADPVVTPTPVLVGPPTNKDQCKKNGWRTFNNPSFRNQGQCEKYVKDHKENGRVEGTLQMGDPRQKISINLSEKEVSDFFFHRGKRNQVEYWNYGYPGVLHYKADALCVNVDKVTKEARFMFQIPNGWPGLSGLYVVSYVKDITRRGGVDLYGHASTSDLVTATAWCETGVGFSPAMYPVTKGNVEVK